MSANLWKTKKGSRRWRETCSSFCTWATAATRRLWRKDEVSNYQKGELGDCLVGVDGKLCAELALALGIAQELGEKTKIRLMYE